MLKHGQLLERYQLLLYIMALLAGGGVGLLLPSGSPAFAQLVWPTLALLLYSTFAQVRLADSVEVFRNGRFFTASLVANFTLVPGIVWLLAWLLPPVPAIRLGVFMVLLVPCTDWFVTFTHLGKGDTRLAVSIVPVQLFAQFGFLMLYLWLFLGSEFVGVVAAGPFLQALFGLIVIPFAMASLSSQAARRSVWLTRWLQTTSRFPVPLLALTLFLIAASQVGLVINVAEELGRAGIVFYLYLLVATLLAFLVARTFRLSVEASRTLAFNLGTRNSFVVLPLALALPPGWEAAVATVVLQTIVELTGIIAYLWGVPRYLFPGGLSSIRTSTCGCDELDQNH